jgi:hypothetical protein
MHFSIAPGIMSGLITLDTVPNPFTFTGISNAMPSTVYDSNVIVIAGITDVTPVVIASGTGFININGTGWVTSGVIEYGQTLQARVTSGAGVSVTVNLQVDVGGIVSTYSVTTVAIAPDPYFPNVYSLLPFVGSYTDSISGDNGGTVGTVTIDSSGAQMGTNASYVAMPARSDGGGWFIGAGEDYTAECFITFNGTRSIEYWFEINGTAPSKVGITSAGAPFVTWASNGQTIGGSVNTTMTAGVRYHVAVVRIGTLQTLYINGNRVGTFTANGATGGNVYTLRTGTGAVCKINNFRLTLGTGRYSGATYTIPESPFPAY